MTAYVLHLSTLILRYCIGGHSLCLVTVSSAFVQLHLVLLRASRLSTTNRFRVPSDSHISCGSSLWISLAMIPRSSTDSVFFFFGRWFRLLISEEATYGAIVLEAIITEVLKFTLSPWSNVQTHLDSRLWWYSFFGESFFSDFMHINLCSSW